MSDTTYADALSELRSLAVGSVILDSDGDAWQLTPDGWTCAGYDGTNARNIDASSVAILTPITVVHRAEHGAEVGLDWTTGVVLHENDQDWHPWDEAVYGPRHGSGGQGA